MDYKVNSLYNKIYSEFIRGEYGVPKIPTKNEIIRKMEEFTTTEYIPVLKDTTLSNIKIEDIRVKFDDVIDDIDVLFDSIEAESKDVLDQLTHSLKEHRGVTRELRRIKSATSDINNGQLGDEYLKYNFTETFNDLNNINTLKSDPVFLDAGVFSISREKDNILSLSHYYGTKLDWSITENFAQIIDQTYVGTTDAATMLDQQDPRQLIYKIKTNRSTRLKASISFQLYPDGRLADINGITVDLDSNISKGWIRVYYRDQHKWKDIKTNSIQEIKSDKILFNFPNTQATHIKLEFIKDSPDVIDTNEYFFIINNLVVYSGASKKSAVLYSKPITFSSYDKETPIVSRIEASVDAQIPETCDVVLYVAQDIELTGQFLDSGGNPVYPDSPNAFSFDPVSGKIFLSDIINAENTISGIELYKGRDFNWQPIKIVKNSGSKIPSVVEFKNTKDKPLLNNSLYNITSRYIYDDVDYTGVYTLSGWVNTSNPSWSLMAPLVTSGILISGVTISVPWEEDAYGNLNPLILSNPLYSGQWLGTGSGGYPFGYTIDALGREVQFNEFISSINGWWRPASDYVTPTGIYPDYTETNSHELKIDYVTSVPDFHFNGLDFYKIYKFGANEDVIDPSIKLYSYQETPLVGDSGYYPTTFSWKYKTKWTEDIGLKCNVVMTPTPPNFYTYIIPVSAQTLRPNEEYIVDSISEVRVYDTSIVLNQEEYFVQKNTSGVITGINLSGFENTSNFSPSEVSFDFKYRYRIKNEYLSTWTGYAIVVSNAFAPTITIANSIVEDARNIPLIKNIDVTNLDTGITKTISAEDGLFTIKFDSISTEGHYKIVIFCASDPNTGFCADNWVPYEGTSKKTVTVSPGVKVVSRLSPITLVDLSSLIYDTPVNNDSKVAYLKSTNNEKFLVVKKPSKDLFPGYYFDSINRQYIIHPESRIQNIGHWIRQGVIGNNLITYTTGSSGNIVYNHSRTNSDLTWNNGATLPTYPNTMLTGIYFSDHSTHSYPINLDSSGITLNFELGDIDPRAPYSGSIVGSSQWNLWLSGYNYDSWLSWSQNSNTTFSGIYNRGYLFYDTAENLPNFYSITYKTSLGSSELNKRFLYKLELLSDNKNNLTPIVKSVRFTINDRI